MNCKMKRYLIYLAAAAALISCQRAEEKDEVEAGFAGFTALPSVSIDKDVEIRQYDKIVKVKATFRGITREMKNLQTGVMSSQSYSFSSSELVAVDPVNGTFEVEVPVLPGVTNWIVAMAGTPSGGAVYSEKIAVEVPDVPWYYKIPESYVGDYPIYGGDDSYESHQVYVEFNSKFTSATIYNFDPYLSEKIDNYKVEDRTTNYVTGDLDVEARTITLKKSGDLYPVNNDIYSLIPISSIDDSSVSIASSFVLTFSDDGQTLTLPWYGVYNANTGYVVSIYTGEVVLSAN